MMKPEDGSLPRNPAASANPAGQPADLSTQDAGIHDDNDFRPLESLLEEIHTGRGPRDFTQPVLLKLQLETARSGRQGAAKNVHPGNPHPGHPHPGHPLGGRISRSVCVAGLAALAASVLVVFWVRRDATIRGLGLAAASSSNAAPSSGIGDSATLETSADRSSARLTDAHSSGLETSSGAEGRSPADLAVSDAAVSPSREPIPLTRDSLSGDDAINLPAGPGSSLDNVPAFAVDEDESPDPAGFENHLKSYWANLGVSPAAPLSRAEWAARIEQRLGATVPSSHSPSGNPFFADTSSAEELATRLVNHLFPAATGGSDAPLLDQRIAEATQSIVRGGAFDHLVRDWLSDEATFAGSRPADVTAEWFGRTFLDADLACARCHDSPLRGTLGQQDYWALAALLRQESTGPLFFELPDGRQRMADPVVAQSLVRTGRSTPQDVATEAQTDAGGRPDNSGSTVLESREALAQQMVGNRLLAQSLVNHLWEISLGAPLVARPSDPLAPPRDDALLAARNWLVDDLLASGFDIGRTARWIVTSLPMRLGPSTVIADGSWRTAAESELAQASLAVRSFAALAEQRPRMRRGGLIALMETKQFGAPVTLDPRRPLLAQASADAPSSAGALSRPLPASPEEIWWTAWVADRETLRGGWLQSISQSDERTRHAFYAAGMRRVDQRGMDFAARLAGEGDGSDTAYPLYWILSKTR